MFLQNPKGNSLGIISGEYFPVELVGFVQVRSDGKGEERVKRWHA